MSTDELLHLRSDNAEIRAELGELRFRLRVANNLIAALQHELEALSKDAGEEINKLLLEKNAA